MFSIIIPMYNASGTIKETLYSIDIASKGLEVEVIVVDDSSTDNSYSIVSNMSLCFCELHLYSSPNKGPQEARNFGLSKATKRHIQWFDADDLMGINRLARAKLILEKQYCDILLCDWAFLNEEYNYSSKRHRFSNGFIKCEDLFEYYWSGVGMFQTGCWLLKREIAEEICWNKQITKNQDGLYFTRALLLAERVYYDNDIAVHYRRPTSGNISRNADLMSYKSRLLVQYYYSRIATLMNNRILAQAARNGLFSIYIDSIKDGLSEELKIAEKLKRWELYTSKGLYYGLIGLITKKYLKYLIL